VNRHDFAVLLFVDEQIITAECEDKLQEYINKYIYIYNLNNSSQKTKVMALLELNQLEQRLFWIESN
jgi:hypothetical protein